MTLAQRMVVMNKGVAEQIGAPTDVFERPASTFVASFIGSPPMNLLPVSITHDGLLKDDRDLQLHVAPQHIPTSLRGQNVTLGIRPEHIALHAEGIPIQIEMIEILGSEQLIHGRHGEHSVVVRCAVDQTRHNNIHIGDTIQIVLNPDFSFHWFDIKTGLRLNV